MVDDEKDGIAGTAAKELEEECGIRLRASDLTDLTELAFQGEVEGGNLPQVAIAPSPGGSDEFLRYMYVERLVTRSELEDMKGRLSGLRDEGEYITLRVVPLKDIWRVSADNKAMWYVCAKNVMTRVVLWFSLSFEIMSQRSIPSRSVTA